MLVPIGKHAISQNRHDSDRSKHHNYAARRVTHVRDIIGQPLWLTCM